jgi:hypothetical protein
LPFSLNSVEDISYVREGEYYDEPMHHHLPHKLYVHYRNILLLLLILYDLIGEDGGTKDVDKWGMWGSTNLLVVGMVLVE